MKKIINNRIYDTDKARSLGCDSYSSPGDFRYWCERLYQKRTGEFFLHGEGGPMTQYAHSLGQNQWSDGEKIIPMDLDAARQWVEDHLDANAYEEIFGLPDEEAGTVPLSLRISAKLAAAARQRAIEDQATLASVVESALSEYLSI